MLALERVRGKFFTRAWGKQDFNFWREIQIEMCIPC